MESHYISEFIISKFLDNRKDKNRTILLQWSYAGVICSNYSYPKKKKKLLLPRLIFFSIVFNANWYTLHTFVTSFYCLSSPRECKCYDNSGLGIFHYISPAPITFCTAGLNIPVL